MFLRAKTRFKDGKEHRYWSIVENRRSRGGRVVQSALDCDIVRIKLSELQLHRPRQLGACWLACLLWDQLRLDELWSDRLPVSRQGTRWLNVFKTLVIA